MPALLPERRWQGIEVEALDWTGCFHVEHAGLVCQDVRRLLLNDRPDLKAYERHRDQINSDQIRSGTGKLLPIARLPSLICPLTIH